MNFLTQIFRRIDTDYTDFFQSMKLRPTRLQFTCTVVAVSVFFGLGQLDKIRLKAKKSPFCAFEYLVGNPDSLYVRSLIYEASVKIPMARRADPTLRSAGNYERTKGEI